MRSKKSCENEVNLFSTAYNLKKIHNKLKMIGRNLDDSIKKIFFWLDYNFFVLESWDDLESELRVWGSTPGKTEHCSWNEQAEEFSGSLKKGHHITDKKKPLYTVLLFYNDNLN